MISKSEIMCIIKQHKDVTDAKERLLYYKRTLKASSKEEQMKALLEFNELSFKNRVLKPK